MPDECPQERAEATGPPAGVPGFRIKCLHLQVGFFRGVFVIKGRDIPPLIALQKGEVMCQEWIMRAPLSLLFGLSPSAKTIACFILKLFSEESPILFL